VGGRCVEGTRLAAARPLRRQSGAARGARPDRRRPLLARRPRAVPAARRLAARRRPIHGAGGLSGVRRLSGARERGGARRVAVDAYVDPEHGAGRTLFVGSLGPRLLPRHLEHHAMPVADCDIYCAMLERARREHFAYPAVNVTSLTTANAVLRGLAE